MLIMPKTPKNKNISNREILKKKKQQPAVDSETEWNGFQSRPLPATPTQEDIQ